MGNQKPLAVVGSIVVDTSAFVNDHGRDMTYFYNFENALTLPYSEGPVDDETFVKYGIITAVNYREAIRRYREAELSSVRESTEAVH